MALQQSSPTFSKKKKSLDFKPLEVLAWVMTACWVLRSRLTYFWRNMSISSIFHFSKSTSINTLYSSPWHTLKMMLFTKCLTKLKCIGRISWEFRYWFNLKSSIELDIKRYVLYLSNAPLTLQNFAKSQSILALLRTILVTKQKTILDMLVPI